MLMVKKDNSTMCAVFMAYLTYLMVAVIIASAMFIANNVFYVLFGIASVCVSLTFAFTFVCRDRIAMAPWKYLSVFVLLFLMIMLCIAYVVMATSWTA
jgi:hypothetical protein